MGKVIAAPHVEVFSLRVPFGWVRIRAGSEGLLGVDVLPVGILMDSEPRSENPWLQLAAHQLSRYFEEASTPLTLPLEQPGTAYQQRVWSAMSGIPAGQTLSYAGLAKIIGSGPRAIAGACKANRFPILIPCHRVVGMRGLGGYCGEREGPMLEIKRWLLTHEAGVPPGP